ncbi:MAG: hypothetical protein IJ719_04350 [Clostridia bacterium]|nr:hypothetical protein [Clostridia bacterium]
MFMKKRIWLFILSLMMMTSAAVAETIISVSDTVGLNNAFSQINAIGGEYTISLRNDITGSIEINNSNATVTIVGNGYTLSGVSQIITVSNGVLNLGDGESELTLAYTGTIDQDPGFVYINGTNAICNMYEKVTIRDSKKDNQFGGGVAVQSGTFHMYGGTIQNCGVASGSVCFGGGVAVYSGGIFIMDGGTIKECYAIVEHEPPGNEITSTGGGVFVSSGGNFVMNGGTIQECHAKYGAGVALVSSYDELDSHRSEGFWGYTNSLVQINGGKFIKNKADLCGGGIFASSLLYVDPRALATSNPRVGINDPTGFFLNGGTLSQNDAYAGGGVFLVGIHETDTQHVQIHNATITSNTAAEGAGIEINSYWTAAEIKDCTITGNEAKVDSDGDGGVGGGIVVLSNTGTKMLGTNILCNNTAETLGADAYLNGSASVTFTSASAMNQTYHNSGIRIDGWYDDTDPRWSEEKASGTGNTFLGDVYELVNKTQGIIAAYTYHEPTEMPLTISLNWDDQDNVDLLRPYEITVRLTDRNGNPLKQTNGEDAVFTLTARDGWRKSLLMVPFDVNTMKVVAEVVEDYTQLEPKVVINADGSISIEMTNQHIPEVTPTPSDTPTPLPTETPELTPGPGEEREDIPDTGDKSNVGVWALLAVFSVVGIVFLITYRRNHRK